MPEATGAELLLRAAIDHNVEVCFANPGTSEMHFVSAMDTVWGLKPVLGLHETVCTGAADGYGRMARKPALTLLHLGPGLANGLCNLHNARRAGTPVVNLVGDMATWHKDADPLLNMDIASVASTVAKTIISCHTGDDLYKKMTLAVSETEQAIAVGGSRVVTIIAPHDLSWERRTDSPPRRPAPPTSPSPTNGTMLYPRVPSPRIDATTDKPPQAHLSEGAAVFLKDCADAMKRCPKGGLAFYIGGRAGIKDGRS